MSAADFRFAIDDEAFQYLVLQKGRLDHLKADRADWLRGYDADLFGTFADLQPVLPAKCRRILDVGSGLGGIDALLNAHYGGDVHVCLVDGLADPPRLERHAQTFNHMGVAERFLRANGVRHFSGHGPDAWPLKRPAMDLVVSFASWCFHIPPADYLGRVLSRCHAGTVLVMDVRRSQRRPDWRDQLDERLRCLGKLADAPKFERLAFAPR